MSIRIKEIGALVTGYSNKLQPGKKKVEFLNISYKNNKEYKVEKVELKDSTIKKLKITKNMVIISPHKNLHFVELGSKHIGKLIGKNLVAIDVNNEKYDVFALYLLFKNNILHIPYEGTIIKMIKNTDLQNVTLPKLSVKLTNVCKEWDNYSSLLKEQEELTQQYIKSILRKGFENGKN